MSEWQDISTAPKDGTFILCAIEGYRPGIYAWQRLGNDEKWMSDPEAFGQQDHFEAYWAETSYEPTLWMHLPPTDLSSQSI